MDIDIDMDKGMDLDKYSTNCQRAWESYYIFDICNTILISADIIEKQI